MKLCKLAILVSILLSFHQTFANSIAAGDFYYEWQSDSTYRFFLKLYIDCSGNAEPSSVPMCLQNPCNTSLNFTATLTKFSGPGSISVSCSKVKTICDSPASNIPGYKEWIYSATVTLPAQCNAWHIFAYAPSRNNSLNIANPTSGNFYTEIGFDNTGNFQGNSSVHFNDKPVYYAGQFMPFGAIPGITNTDGDSISVELAQPQTGVSSCSGTPTNVTYVTTSPLIALPSNPFQTNNSFTLNDSGIVTFNGAVLGKNTACFKITEYRNNTLIGYTMREAQYYVMQPYRLSTTVTSSSNILGCVGKPFNLLFTATNHPNTNLVMTADSLPQGAAISYYGQHTDSVSAVLSYTPQPGDGPVKRFIVTAIDSTCYPPGIVPYYAISNYVKIADPMIISDDTTICIGDTVGLWAQYGEYHYQWQLLNGSANNNGCWTCSSLSVFPNTTSTYVITSSGDSCGVNYSDTVTVQVKTSNQHPTISISTYPDSVITFGQQVLFIAATTNCAQPLYQWQVNGVDVPGETSDSFLTSGLIDADLVSCRLLCADTCPQPRYSTSSGIKMSVGIRTIQKNKQGNFNIYPNPNNGSFTLTGTTQNAECRIFITDIIGKQLYKKSFVTAVKHINEQIECNFSPGTYFLKVNDQTIKMVVDAK
ncbi:MAG: hypothetical protein BGO70_17820 [Bacteroidetes bacterium 43-93]|nr:T9SS type A sorting domain-containing protein [Bacteroidota bacterium]OJX01599.1 MAG: hypothetical protein BGO70_17820 [Bacteroidetes bacterium 43-93]